MKLRCWNVNGLRAVSGKGFLDWFQKEDADFVCLQEIKATPDQIDPSIRWIKGYESFWNPAVKAGYSGTAIFSKHQPQEIIYGMNLKEADEEGRVLQLDFGKWVLITAYFPNSQPEGVRLGFKLKFCESMLKLCQEWTKKGRQVVLCGDYNIAHREIDLRNPKSNEKTAGFLPEERAWMDVFLKNGFADSFRKRNPDAGGHYTWWSYRAGSRPKNVGWRIDYFCVNDGFDGQIERIFHQPDVQGSDHCPVGLDLKPF